VAWEMLAGGCLVLAVAVLLFLGLFRARTLLGATSLLPAASRRWVRGFVVGNFVLMVVFFSGSLLVTFTFLTGSRSGGALPVSLTLLAGSLMALLSTLLHTRMILGLQKTLAGIVPVCSGCKKIRRPDLAEEDPEAWQVVDTYLERHTAAMITHGLCPDCLERMYPEMARELRPGAG
jgi:hypothetical protein